MRRISVVIDVSKAFYGRIVHPILYLFNLVNVVFATLLVFHHKKSHNMIYTKS